MGSFFKTVNDMMLGSPGKILLDNILSHQMLYLSLFLIYGLLLLYARFVYLFLIPRVMTKLIKNNKGKSLEEIYNTWKRTKRCFSSLLLVPTKNELWVQKLNSSNGKYNILFFNKENGYESELELLSKIYNNL